MRMTRPDGPEVTSYLGAFLSILTSLTLTQWGILVGIATALATWLLNLWATSKRVKREEEESERARRAEEREREEHEARMALLKRGINV